MLAIVWVMVEKPAWGGGIAALVIAYAVGVATAIALTRTPVVELETVTEPSSSETSLGLPRRPARSLEKIRT